MKKTFVFVLFTFIFAGLLTGCGRKGALQLPASSLIENDEGKMVRKPKGDRPFILDPLIR